MQFQSRQQFEASVDEVEQAMLDPDYLPFQLEHHPVLLEVELLERSEKNGTVQRRIRYRPKPVIKSIGPRTVPPEWFAFVESSTYDRATRTLSFTNTATTAKISRMLVNTGKLTLSPLSPTRTERTLEGEISLKLPFLLKPLALIGEQVIRGEGLKILDGEVPVMERYVREHLRGG
ncbi:MAG TPA: DUF2505 family protein [Myxococcaceae bacterium]|nr:DUF2505 family protein [Myxococcaceae bacterium]